MNPRLYSFDAVIEESSRKGGAFVRFPYDLREEFGRGRVKVLTTFDEYPYEGCIVNMGLKNEDGSTAYIIGLLKEIRLKMGKTIGDTVQVTIQERD